MNRLLTCALALGLFGAGLTAQAWTSDRVPTDSTETKVVQVSGLVVTGDSLSPLPYCTVYRARDRRGTMTDVRGFFSLPALEGDTLEFSSVGYVTHQAIIPAGSEMGRVNLVQPMGRDTVNMADAFVYPAQQGAVQERILGLGPTQPRTRPRVGCEHGPLGHVRPLD